MKDLTDNRFTVRNLLEDELSKISDHQKKLVDKTQELSDLQGKINNSLAAIEKIQIFITKDEDGKSSYSHLLDLIKEENLESLKEKSNVINNTYTKLFDQSGEDASKIDQVNREIEKISRQYEKLFDELNDNDETKVNEYERKVNELVGYYDKLFLSDNPDGKSKNEQIDSHLTDVQRFYDKIYGNEEKNIPALNNDLDNRLKNLKDVEERAKSVIGLSSEAGLAGGFVLKGNEAKRGQVISVIVFVLIFIFLKNQIS